MNLKILLAMKRKPGKKKMKRIDLVSRKYLNNKKWKAK